MKPPFCRIEPDLANGTTAGTSVNIKHLPREEKENGEATAAGEKSFGLISLDLLEAPQVRQTPCYNCDEAAVPGRADLDYLSSL